jgi:hypothetical protein
VKVSTTGHNYPVSPAAIRETIARRDAIRNASCDRTVRHEQEVEHRFVVTRRWTVRVG